MNTMIEIGRKLKNSRLVWSTSGNMSTRLNEDNIVITASGSTLSDLSNEDLCKIHLISGKEVGKRATKEKTMHTGIYKLRPDVGAIIHTSPLYATMFCCTDEEIQKNLFIESMVYLGKINYIPYRHPGSQELAELVSQASKDSDIIMMRNHGVVICGKDLKVAFNLLETLEVACEMIVKAKAAGIKLKSISHDEVMDFHENAGYKRR